MESKSKRSSSIKRTTRSKSNSDVDIRKSTRRISSKVKTVETVRLTASNIRNFMPGASKDEIIPEIWELPNRKRFNDWVIKTFDEKYDNVSEIPKTASNENPFNPKVVQRLIHDFMRGSSPYHGLLLYYGLGVGKSCSALAISEAINTLDRVLFVSKASLEDNFKGQIKFCGAEYMRQMNHWVFCDCDSPAEQELAAKLGITPKMIDKNGGIFLIDYSQSEYPNYQHMTSGMKSRLNQQIDMMLANRFQFLHTDDPRYHFKISQADFDNSVIIVDEVHNLINTIASGNSRGQLMYNYFMNATNSRFIFLSATPMINRVYEASPLFNILRGYMPYLEFTLKSAYDSVIDFDNIKYALQQNKYVDQVSFNRIKKLIRVSRNPANFITSATRSNQGLLFAPKENINDEEFKDAVEKIIGKYGYEYTIREGRDTALPVDEVEFERQFYNVELNKMKKTELFKRRIAGLTSFYGYLDPKLFPKASQPKIELVPMSDYQQTVYENVRHDEITKEKNQRKKRADEQFPGTFRIYSRFACSIAFPEELIGSSKEELLEHLTKDERTIEEIDGNEEPMISETLTETAAESLSSVEMAISEADRRRQKKELDVQLKSKLVSFFRKNKDKYLDIDNGSLAKYSPKYLSIIKNLVKSPGTALVYSQFVTLQGLFIFSLALEQTGEYQQFSIRKVGSQWQIDNPDWDPKKKSFIFYSGKEDKEMREIYIKIFNSQWDKLDSSCDSLAAHLKSLYGEEQNLYGKVINVFLTNRTGAEGIDLKHVRQVHIMEPYWQYVLMDQVIGRAVRTNSHIRLPEKDRTVDVFFYLSTLTPEQIDKIGYVDVRRDTCRYNNDPLGKYGKVVTTDEAVYILAKRKDKIISECQLLIKESAFDCSLFYADNVKMPENSSMRCLDFPSKDRGDYLFVPNLADTEEIKELGQEKIVEVVYKAVMINGKKFYYPSVPDPSGNTYLYDETFPGKARPRPVGKVVKFQNGKPVFGMFKKTTK
jgi:hypothetical protein